MGGFGHARLVEAILGGVSRQMLTESPVPSSLPIDPMTGERRREGYRPSAERSGSGRYGADAFCSAGCWCWPSLPLGRMQYRGPIERMQAGDALMAPQLAPDGPVTILVSLPLQRAYVYRNGVPVAVSTVSTAAMAIPPRSGYSRSYRRMPIIGRASTARHRCPICSGSLGRGRPPCRNTARLSGQSWLYPAADRLRALAVFDYPAWRDGRRDRCGVRAGDFARRHAAWARPRRCA